MIIGTVKEIKNLEFRVGLTQAALKSMLHTAIKSLLNRMLA